MLELKPHFDQSALPPALLQTRASDAWGNGSERAEAFDTLTLEFNHSPFRAFMKEVEVLIETDPNEALRLLKLAIDDSVFERKHQLEKLTTKVDEVLDVLKGQNTPEQTMENEPDAQLDSAFSRRKRPALGFGGLGAA